MNENKLVDYLFEYLFLFWNRTNQTKGIDEKTKNNDSDTTNGISDVESTLYFWLSRRAYDPS
tara:strand:- start:159 stop:344 length:186 start_codon:yes stop_codon:yes gene_type:complete